MTLLPAEEDLDNLFRMLEDLNRGRPFSQRVVLTPFWVVAGPDYEAMRETGCPVRTHHAATAAPPLPPLARCARFNIRRRRPFSPAAPQHRA